MASKNKVLVAQEQALGLFLESLLRETEVEPAIETTVEVELAPETTVVESLPEVETAPSVDIEPEQPDSQSQPAGTTVVAEDVVDQPPATTVVAAKVYDEPFQAMLFEVAGLKLAIPLVELSGVLEWNDDITAMPGHADFYLGILQHLGRSIPVIDTARVIFPPDKLDKLVSDEPRQRIKRIVLIDDSRWGLGCDSVNEVVELTPDQVKWRPESNTRQWLAGTVIEQMCALINGAGFAQLLKTGQK